MRIFGVDVVREPPSSSPVPGRAQAWDVVNSFDGTAEIYVRFVDEAGDLVVHTFAAAASPFLGSQRASTIVVLASHPNDVRSAIASYRVLGWTPIAEAPAGDFGRYGYALCVLSSPRQN